MVYTDSPVLVVENVPGMVPAATVSTSGAGRDVAGLCARCVRQATRPGGSGGGSPKTHWHPPDPSTQARNIQSGMDARSNQRGTGAIVASPADSSTTASHRSDDAIGVAYLDEDQPTLEGVTHDVEPPGIGRWSL
ncbi:hypothetical protein [Sorangium sp. So ce124]|uniref:hypothetical protein n=1 Tax=Sorangium sp. So ce124 TaxID=3133280 RepID=UPI003F63D626